MTNEEFYNQFKKHANKLGLNTSDKVSYGQRLCISFLLDPDKASRWIWEFHPGDNQRITMSWHVGDKHYHDWCDLNGFLSIDQTTIDMFIASSREADRQFDKLKEDLKQLPVDQKRFIKSLVGR